MSLLLIALVGLVAYAGTFDVPFVFDDEYTLVDNPDIRSLTGFHAQLTRYVAYLTFALNYHFGKLDVFGYHVVNLSIHLLAAMLVYVLLQLIFHTPFLQGRESTSEGSFPSLRASVFVPLFAALLFVSHPIQTQAVTYIVQRMTSLTTFFYLLALVSYLSARILIEKSASLDADSNGGDLRRKKLLAALLIGGATAAAVLAMTTKEIAITLPLTALLCEIYFFRGAWKKRFLYVLPLLLTLPIVPLAVLTSGESAGELLSDVAEKTRSGTGVSRWDYLFTQFRVIVTYLRLLLLPIQQNVDYHYPLQRSFFAPEVLLSFLLLAGLLALAATLFLRTRSSVPGLNATAANPLARLVSFGICWFFLTLSVESSVIPIVDVIFEHRLYLPGVGAALAFATLFFLVCLRCAGKSSGRLIWLPAVIVIIGLTVATIQRNQVWGSGLSLWQDTVSKSPDKGRPLNNLGVALEAAGRRSEAMEALTRAIRVSPNYHRAYYNLADLYLVSGQPEAALPLLDSAIRMKPDFAEAYVKAGAALIRNKRFRDAAFFLQKHLDLIENNGEARFYLGAAYVFTGNREGALRELEVVKQLDAALAADLAGLLGLGGRGPGH